MNSGRLLAFGLLLLLLAVPFVHAEVSRESTASATLYEARVTQSQYHITTGLAYNNRMRMSTSSIVISPAGAAANDLPDGAVICPGTLTETSVIDGDYAHGSWYVHTYNNNPGDTASNTESSYAAWSGGYASDLPVDFSVTRYNNLDVSNSIAYESTPPGAWNAWTANDNQKIDALDLYNFDVGTFTVNNKRGKTGMICRAQTTLQSTYSGNTVTSNVNVENNAASRSVTADENHLGDYAFQSKLRITGCGIVTYPQLSAGSKYKNLASRISVSNGKEYTYNQDDTPQIKITVKNPQMRFTTSNVNPGNIQIAPGGTAPVSILVTNTGFVGFIINQVSIDQASFNQGFRITPAAGVPGNIYGTELAPGTQGIVTFQLQAPNPIPPNAQVTISFTAAQTSVSCNVPSGTVTINTIFHVDQQDIYGCALNPNAMVLSQLQPGMFNMTCTANGLRTLCPANAQNLAFTINPQCANFVSYVGQGSFAQPAHVNVAAINGRRNCVLTVNNAVQGYTCSANINLNYLEPDSCTLAPASYIFTRNGETTAFNMRCYRGGAEVPCPPDDSNYTVTINPAQYAAYTGYIGPAVLGDPALINVRGGSTDGSAGILVMERTGRYYCSANLQINISRYACSVNPNRRINTIVNTSNIVDLNCTFGNRDIPCGNRIQWDVSGTNDYILRGRATSRANLTLTDRAQGDLNATVVIGQGLAQRTLYCGVPFGATIPPSPYYCMAFQALTNTTIGVPVTTTCTCYRNGVPIPCNTLIWNVSGSAPSQILSADNVQSLVNFTGIGSADVNASSQASENGITYTFSCAVPYGVGPVPNPKPDFCNITYPGAIPFGTEFHPDITCYNLTWNPNMPLPCTNVTWSLDPVNAGTIYGDNLRAVCTLPSSETLGFAATIRAVGGEGVRYNCQLNASKKQCKIAPQNWVGRLAQSREFRVTCGDTPETRCDETTFWPDGRPVWNCNLGGYVSLSYPDLTNRSRMTIRVTRSPDKNLDNGELVVNIKDMIGNTYVCKAGFGIGAWQCINYI